uniref:Ovule protein n=1 Tax=Strongyloides venezuelensis TaxID=75913 RepID=A0A0K0FIM6_STRVS
MNENVVLLIDSTILLPTVVLPLNISSINGSYADTCIGIRVKKGGVTMRNHGENEKSLESYLHLLALKM